MSELLNPTQTKVMAWLGHGWEARPGAGTTVLVNDTHICNRATIDALIRMNLVEPVTSTGGWRATAAGEEFTEKHGL